jgi:hypothetical protein
VFTRATDAGSLGQSIQGDRLMRRIIVAAFLIASPVTPDGTEIITLSSKVPLRKLRVEDCKNDRRDDRRDSRNSKDGDRRDCQ